jgi:hypothetical protein
MGSNRRRITILLCLIILPILLIVGWYTMPYFFRELYYLKHDKGVCDEVVLDEHFDISTKGFSKTYDYSNKYLMPALSRFYFTKLNKGLSSRPPVDISQPIQLYDLQLKAELLRNEKVYHTVIGKEKLPISYAARRKQRFMSLAFLPISYRAKFFKDTQLRLTVIQTDPRLDGCEGTLIVRPRLSH